MRNRMIKKEFWTDDKILELNLTSRLLFIGIWNFSDDEGISKNNPKVLKAQIFPADDISPGDIDIMLKNMVKIGLLLINEDFTLIKVRNWTDHQKISRPTPSKYEFNRGDDVKFTEDSLSNQGILSTNRIEYNRKKKKVIHQTNKKDELFDEWYNKYPRKVGKQAAIKAWNKPTLTDDDKNKAIQVIDNHIKYWIDKDTEVEHIPHPATWLNNRRFEDVLQAVNLKEQRRADKLARQEANDKANTEQLSKEANTPEALAAKDKALKEAMQKIRRF